MQIKKLSTIVGGQDGAIYKNYLFRFSSKGGCTVYDLTKIEGNMTPIAEFKLDRVDFIVPHSNSVIFGNEFFAEGDEFPLLYSNVYNNYAKTEDKRVGICCVYRLVREGMDPADRDTLILTADTLVTIDGIFLGKPLDGDDAARMLARLAGRTHTVASGICLSLGGKTVTAHECTEVCFAPMTAEEYDAREAKYVQQIAAGQKPLRVGKNMQGRTHACLIGWEALAELSNRENRITGKTVDYQAMDTENVLIVPELLRADEKTKA